MEIVEHKELNPDYFTPEMPDDPSGLPGNPQFRPGLPSDISKALRNSENIEKIMGVGESGKEKDDPEKDLPEWKVKNR